MRFSIITISFNSEKTIERTIKSVLSQSFKDYEYIIVDGGSKDCTLDIIRHYEPLFEGRMKWKSEPDNGIYNAMNKGIERSCGEIISIVNSDDWLEPNALDIMNYSFDGNGRDVNSVYCGWMNFHYKDGSVQIMKTDHHLLDCYSKRCEMAGVRHPAVFVGSNVYKQYGTFDETLKVLADTDFIVRCYLNGVRFVYPNQVVTNMSDGGVSNDNLMKACKDYGVILKKNNVQGVKYYYLYNRWKIKRYVKSLLPVSLIKRVREIVKA